MNGSHCMTLVELRIGRGPDGEAHIVPTGQPLPVYGFDTRMNPTQHLRFGRDFVSSINGKLQVSARPSRRPFKSHQCFYFLGAQFGRFCGDH